jgi:Spy/CpxP family protein refolding chaperone
MAHIGLKYVKFDALTDKQKQELKDLLQQQKRDLQTAIRATDAGLKKLSQKPKSKRRSKRRPAVTRRDWPSRQSRRGNHAGAR